MMMHNYDAIKVVYIQTLIQWPHDQFQKNICLGLYYRVHSSFFLNSEDYNQVNSNNLLF